MHVHVTKYTNQHTCVFVWAPACQHTHTRNCFQFGTFALRMLETLKYVFLDPYPTTSGSAAASTDRLCDLCDRLLSALEGADMLGRSCKRRSAILRTLFRLIDLDSARLSLHIAELCLAVSFLYKCGFLLLSTCHWAMWAIWAPKYRFKILRVVLFPCSWLSVETTCSTSVKSSSRFAAVKATTSFSRETPSLVNIVLFSFTCGLFHSPFS